MEMASLRKKRKITAQLFSPRITPKVTKEKLAFNCLPNEVLNNVFSRLDGKDLLRACQVCKKWLKLINCKSLLSDMTVVITCPIFEDYQYASLTRKFLSFDFTDLTTHDNRENGMNLISSCVEILHLEANKCNRNIIFRFDKKFEKLKQLTLFSHNSWQAFPSCPNLETLSLHAITDSSIGILQKTMKRLEVLNLDDVAIVDDTTECGEYQPPGVTSEEYPSSDILSVSALKSFISERVHTLSEIDLGVTPLTVNTLKELLCIEGLNLSNLHLHNDESSSPDIPDFFIDVFRHHQDLKTLELSEFNLNDNVGDDICVFLPNIEELEMLSNITDKCLKDVFQLEKLKKLCILNCADYTPSGCREAMASFKSIQIKHFRLQNFVLPTDSALFFKPLTNLVQLHLTLSLVTDSHVHIISTYLVNLEDLVLSKNDGISDYGLTAGLDQKENKDNTKNTTGYKALYNLERLRRLDFSSCTKLTDDGIIAAVIFPLLSSLTLKNLNFAENTYSVLRSQNPKLTYIDRCSISESSSNPSDAE